MDREMDPIRLLICDDYYIIREGLKVILGREVDMQVVGEAETAEEALRLADDVLPDVAIMDIILPGMDGIQACGLIRVAHPSVAIVALTRFDDEEHILQIYQAGASAYLPKAVKAAELISTIRTVFAGGVVMPPRIADAVFRTFRKSAESPLNPVQSGLSTREVDVLRLVAQGLSNKEIGRELCISVRTVQNHISNIFRKLELNNRASASVYAVNQGLARAASTPVKDQHAAA